MDVHHYLTVKPNNVAGPGSNWLSRLKGEDERARRLMA
jgi:hypothetical protein